MSRWLVCVLVATALIAGRPLLARDGAIDRLDVVETGLYRAEVISRTPAPEATGGFSAQLRDVTYYDHSRRVPAKVGIKFGTRVLLVGAPKGRRANMRSIWRIPHPGAVDPRNGITYRESKVDVWSNIGSRYSRGYHFNEPWQIVCGEWIQKLWQGERKLLSQTFTVEGCEGVPISAVEPSSMLAAGACAGKPGGAAACRDG